MHFHYFHHTHHMFTRTSQLVQSLVASKEEQEKKQSSGSLMYTRCPKRVNKEHLKPLKQARQTMPLQ